MLPSSVMRGTLEPQTDPLLDLLEFPMGENPGGRKPNYKKNKKNPIFKNIFFFCTYQYIYLFQIFLKTCKVKILQNKIK